MEALIDMMSMYKAAFLAGGLALLWFLEHWFAFYEDQKENKIKHDSRNIAMALVNIAVISIAFAWAARMASDWTLENQTGILNMMEMPAWARIAGVILILDLWIYFWHRIAHGVGFMWRFHRVHHSDPAMDASSGFRFHVGEVAISALVRASLIPLFGLELWEVVLYEAVMTPMVLMHHSNVEMGKLDDWMRLIFVSPNMHRVHHSDYQPETDSNFGVVFSWWDRIFKTYNGRQDVENITLGLKDTNNERWQSMGGMLKTPLYKSGETHD